jgi:hypothetical protein
VILYGNDIDDDSRAIRGLFNGLAVLDARLEVDIVAPTIWDLPPGLYRVKVPSRWPFDPKREGMGRRRPTAASPSSHRGGGH